ncbi:SDR family NAD(P)-dependent oxidoreductase [Paenibacillus lycopersici]|uniref:SDR family NAD(P)-dependent oxidoreductase n=1 Tax=Paenibacillus lycopersici TaxID=2704462 RepID=A0A6C0FTI0_9BACL|nr:SDR family NAD(P)-dependent oxidoreductase [Paenibacillus lycopersici]QHT58761.1 SDR family NAD(P)-dependent oxidoreductase [Paenibacillus lycopersici]
MPVHASKVALITGGNRGLGYETARQLGGLGYTVLIGARSKEKGTQAAAALQALNMDAHFIELDVTVQATIDAAARTIATNYGKLDVLINNAGIGDRHPFADLSLADLQQSFAANFFGAFAVSQAMLPLLESSDAPRIVNLSSSIGSIALHSDPDSGVYPLKALAYSSSKAALNQLTTHLAFTLKHTPAKVNSVCPGFVATDFNNGYGDLTPEQGSRIIVRYATLAEDGSTGGFFNEQGAIPW